MIVNPFAKIERFRFHANSRFSYPTIQIVGQFPFHPKSLIQIHFCQVGNSLSTKCVPFSAHISQFVRNRGARDSEWRIFYLVPALPLIHFLHHQTTILRLQAQFSAAFT